MSRDQYHAFIDALCDAYGVEDAAAMHEICNLRIGAVSFTLRHAGDDDPDGVLVYADYGEPPQSNREQILLQLLQINFFMLDEHLACFGFDGQTGHVILMNRFELAQISIEYLMSKLREIMTYIMRTRESLYTTVSNSSPGAPEALRQEAPESANV
jgi:hypothetical protein